MVTTHNLGFPRIGAKRELKFALEEYWKNTATETDLFNTGKQLRRKHWQLQNQQDYITVGDFSFYDHVLDTSFLVGNIPERATQTEDSVINQYFRAARGRSVNSTPETCTHAAEMTKWFDTNYHYIVPEFNQQTQFSLHAESLLAQIDEALTTGKQVKPVILGPLTYLWLGKTQDQSDKLQLLQHLLPVYSKLLAQIAERGISWVQIDEPILVTELDQDWIHAFNNAYAQLQGSRINILLASYFGEFQSNIRFACELPVQGLHLDVINASNELIQVIDWLPSPKVLSLGIINGRNIWKADLNAILDYLEPIYKRLQERLWIAPSCSLLHVPVDLNHEQTLDDEIRSWLSFAIQKLQEINIIAQALNHGREKVAEQLQSNAQAINGRKISTRVTHASVQQRLAGIENSMGQRHSSHAKRRRQQQQQLGLPVFPTTSIGSFPQTQEIRQARAQLLQGTISKDDYQVCMKQHIKQCIQAQEQIGLDVLVHGEAERNDMVEYFGALLQGYAFSQNGWVQSYGSRCVKPPIIYGDVSRSTPMTVNWTEYANTLTDRPVKGMLTGPVTLLNWSFVRDDQPLADTCLQLALAMRDEVLDLEAAGVKIIQIDEAALREGLPLRKSQWKHYLGWAVNAFRLAANGVSDQTQIHTHMCYSEFNDIIEAIAAMDADVISIETSRSNMELLDAFINFEYPNQIGPGVYDIHSPNIPTQEVMIDLLNKAAQNIPIERLWVNPDCGLKTRQWDEVKPALENMVQAALHLRREYCA